MSNMCQVLYFQILIFEGLPGVNFEKKYNYLNVEKRKSKIVLDA